MSHTPSSSKGQEGAWQCGNGHMFRYEPPPASPPWCSKTDCRSMSFAWIIKDEVTGRDWLPDEPDDEPTEDFTIRRTISADGSIIEWLPHRPMPHIPVELTPEEQREAAQRYIEARYGDSMKLLHHSTMPQPEEPPPYADIQKKILSGEISLTEAQQQIIKGVYDKMVGRNPDGSDPLVQEPKGKP